MNREYFATLEPELLAKELKGKIDQWYQWCMLTGRLGRWRSAYDTYYGQKQSHKSSHISSGGEQGELSLLMANEYRNLVQHVLVMTTQSRPSFEVSTTNTDSKSLEQGILGRHLLDYYWNIGGITDIIYQALEISLVMDSSFVFTEWDVTKGEGVRPDESGQMINTGDISCTFKNPLDVIIDCTKENATGHSWQIKSDLVNKFDLAAQFPDKAEDILAVSRDFAQDNLYRFGDSVALSGSMGDTDLIRKWTFYHLKTPSVPQGRMFQFVGDNTWLFDGPLPYANLPGRRVCPSEMVSSTMGYSNMNDLLAIQDCIDAVVSAAVTNMTTCGVNNIWSKPNSNINFERLGEGMNFIESEDKPEVLIMNRLSPETFSLVNFLIQRMEAYSGVNAVSRGNTQGKDLSGSAMALLQSMSISYNSGMQRAYNQVLENVGNDIIYNLQAFGDEEMTALIAGSFDGYMVKSFTKNDIDKIKRVFVKQGNPLQDTTSGKLTLFEQLSKIPNAISNVSEGLQVLTTGRLELTYEGRQKELLSIRKEGESLSKGESVPVAFTENHQLHIDQHRYVILDPESKTNPELLQNVLTHIQEHLKVWQETDPTMIMAMGMQPFPMAPMPPMEGMPPGQGPPPMDGMQGPPPGPQGPPPEGPPQLPPQSAEPDQPRLPSMPNNPLTGKDFNTETGGL